MNMKIFSAAAVMAAIVVLHGASALAVSRSAEVLAVGGVVEVAKKGASGWKLLQAGGPLPSGQTVRCGVTGGAVLRWFSGNVAKIRHLTSLSINELSTDTSRGLESSELEVIYGQVHILAKPLPSPESALRVKTPAAVAEVRGSAEFFVMVDTAAGRTTFTALEGQIMVESQGIAVVLDNGYQIAVDSGQPPGEIITIPDDAKTELFAEALKVKKALQVPPQPEPQQVEVQTSPDVNVAQASGAAGTATQPAAATTEEKKPPVTTTASAKATDDKKPQDNKAAPPPTAAATTTISAAPQATATIAAAKPAAVATTTIAVKPAENKPVDNVGNALKAEKKDEAEAPASSTITTVPAAKADQGKKQEEKKAGTTTAGEQKPVPASGNKTAPAPQSDTTTAQADKKASQPAAGDNNKPTPAPEATTDAPREQEAIEDMIDLIMAQ